MRIVKLMSYLHVGALEEGSQGGAPNDIVGKGNGCGAHHAGSFSLGFRDANGGRPKTLGSDWPATYGKLTDSNEKYNAHLIAIDYRGGVRDPIPTETLAAYNRNADLWDCCAGAIVPFTGAELDQAYQNYWYNPLDLYDQKSAVAVAQNLARFDTKKFLTEHGAFYCAEGQFVVANLGPQEQTLLKKSKFGSTEFGRRIDNFLGAPGYRGKSALEMRRSPRIGWDHLKQLGMANGGITAEHYAALQNTDRLNTALEWIPENIKGWQTYRPLQADGLIARPMTVATLAWGLFRNYMPIGGIAQVLTGDVLRAYSAGTPQVKAAITQMCNGQAPTSPAGSAVLSGIALKAAVGFMLGVLSDPTVRGLLLQKAGYEEIKNRADKKTVEAAYDDFVATFKAADFTSQASVDKALWEADARLAKVQVERDHLNKATGGRVVIRESLMRYAAPTAFLLWTQHPFLAETAACATSLQRCTSSKRRLGQQSLEAYCASLAQVAKRSPIENAKSLVPALTGTPQSGVV